MKKIVSIILCVGLFFWILSKAMVLGQSYSKEQVQQIKDKVKKSVVLATIKKDCEVFIDENMNKVIDTIKKGERVEILKDKTTKIYLIKSEKLKLKGWVKAENLNIDADPLTNYNTLSDIEIEIFANSNADFISSTNYFVWTDIDRQLTYIFKGKKHNWRLIKTIVCATGLNKSPTTKGFFKIGDRGKWFFSERLESGAMFWVRFNNSYLFHSVAMDKNKNVIDNVVGERRSSGCVRMTLEDIQWFYNNIPYGTTVFIN